MHLKVFLKLKKSPKNSLFWTKKQKNTKKHTELVFFKNPGFFQPCLELLLLARQRDVKELLLLANVTERGADVPLKVVPLEAKLFRRHCVVTVGSLVGKGL
jgi:hypothetical protein